MSQRQESAAPEGAIIDDRDVVIAGHHLVVLDADRNEIARLGEQGELDIVGNATLNRFGLELFDRNDNSAVRISMASLGLEGPIDTVGGQSEGLPEIETPFRTIEPVRSQRFPTTRTLLPSATSRGWSGARRDNCGYRTGRT